MEKLAFLSLVLLLLIQFLPISSPEPIHIFLLAGQSNMAGRGGVSLSKVWDRVVPPECQANPSIQRLNPDLAWEEAVEPIHRDIDSPNNTVGIGPGMPFSTTLLKKVPLFKIGDIGLVPAAKGGTTISEWQRGTFLYNRLLARAQVAVLGGGLIRGMLWYQGESDADHVEDANMYKARLEQFFSDIRSDLFLPLMPIIQVALAGGQKNATNVDIVRKAQLEFDAPFVKCIDAKGLKLEPDRLHLTTESQVQLGKMFAEAFLGLC